MKGFRTLLPGERAALVQRVGVPGGAALDVALGRRPLAELVDRAALGVGRQLVEQRVLGRDDAVGHAEAGVRPRGEHPQVQVLLAVDREIELGALRSDRSNGAAWS